jgi:hypothetical protein
MNKSHKQIVYSVLESIYNHHITDDVDISIEFVKQKINDVNIRLIEEFDQQGRPLDMFYSKACCIDVVCEKDGCVIDGVTVPSGDIIWKADLPSLNQKVGWKNIAYFGNSDMRTNFHRVTINSFTSGGVLEWSRKTSYTIVGETAYFKNLPTSGISKLCIVGLFSNPTTVCNFDEESPYPTPDAYKLELLVKQDILSTYPLKPKDEINDSRSNDPQSQNQQMKPQPNE